MGEGKFWKNIGLGKKAENITKPMQPDVDKAVEDGGITKERAEFEKKWGYKIKTWEKQGYTTNMEELLEAYKKNPNLEPVTTKDMKIAWGRPTNVKYSYK